MPAEGSESRTANPPPPQGEGGGIQTLPTPPEPTESRDGANTPAPAPARRPRRRWLRWAVLGVLALAVLGAGVVWGAPYGRAFFTTVSTDDAYVNSHVTY